MNVRLATLIVLFACAAGGCVGFRGPSGIQHDLSRSTGVLLERDVTFSVGPVGTWLARRVARWSDEDIPVSLNGVRRVEVGVYRVVHPDDPAETSPIALSEFDPDWNAVVEVHDEHEQVFVLTKLRDDSIRQLLVVVVESDEWVIVRMKGRLDDVIEDAIRFAAEQADYEGEIPYDS